jgi:adenosine kinase
MKECEIIYTTGFFMEVNSDSVFLAAQFALEQGKVFGFNLAAEYLLELHPEKIIRTIKYSDILYCNKEEAEACAAFLGE